MHPTLTPHKHQNCYTAIMDLSNCHIENPILKFFGICNKYKNDLNSCLQQEFEVVRRQKYEEAKKKRERVEKLWKEIEEEKEASK